MEYILNTKPIIKEVDKLRFFAIKNKIKENANLSNEEIELFLDFYVASVRETLQKGLNIDIENDPLINRCDLAQKLIGTSLEKAGVTVYPQETQETINKTVVGHSFLVAFFNDMKDAYLVDLTYRQLFIKENCDIDRLMVADDMIVRTPDPGFFVSQSEELIETASNILEKGYIKLDERAAKHYGDSFYFTKTGRDPYSNISGSAYLNAFLTYNKRYSLSDERFKETGFNL